jgi:hypothetical protein
MLQVVQFPLALWQFLKTTSLNEKPLEGLYFLMRKLSDLEICEFKLMNI